jgi:hypothetical protein
VTMPTSWPPRTGGRHHAATKSDSEVGNSEFPTDPSVVPDPRETAENSEIRLDSEVTDGEDTSGFFPADLVAEATARAGRIWTWTAAEFRPPTVWTDSPASVAALLEYAKTADWAAPGGPWRAAGIWWARLIGIPLTVLAYYAAWIVQRPGRFLTVLFLYALLAQTTPGRWLLPWPNFLLWPFPWLVWPF